MADGFSRAARHISNVLGTPWAFAMALAVIVTWAAIGPFAGFSSTWQLVINTGTTIVTFLMVFLIQNTQNRDAETMQLKLDELINVLSSARNGLIDLEDASAAEIAAIRAEFARLRSPDGGLRTGTEAP